MSRATESLKRPGTPPSPGVTALFSPDADADQQIYITFDNGHIYLVTAQAPTEDLNEKAVLRMRATGGGNQGRGAGPQCRADGLASGVLNAKVLGAREANLMEDAGAEIKTEGDSVRFDLHPFEIKTIKLRLGGL